MASCTVKKKPDINRVHLSSATNGVMRLKIQRDFLDKAQAFAINKCMKNLDPSILKCLTEMYSEMEKKRTETTEKLHWSLVAIISSLKKMKQAISSDDKLQHLDIAQYRQDIIELENNISTTKDFSEHVLKQLGHEERELWEEIQNMKHKIEDWDNSSKTIGLKTPPCSRIDATNFYMGMKEVTEFQKFIQDKGGHTGGWKEADHLLFKQLHSKYTDENIFLKIVRDVMPDKSLEEIQDHEMWCNKYDLLRSLQKKAIQDWRAQKVEPKIKENYVEKPVPEWRRSKIKEAEMIEKKQKIEEWKRQKQALKELEEEKRKEEKLKELVKLEKKREKQEMIKAQVQRYNEEKRKKQSEALTKEAREAKDLEAKAAIINSALKAFREQDEIFLSRKSRKGVRPFSEKEPERQRVKTKARRDPERLYQLTEASRSRMRHITERDSSSFGRPVLHVNNMPHLYV